MNQFILKLRILLLQNKLYYFLFILITIVALIITNSFSYNSIYDINETNFLLKINSYKIDGNKLTIELNWDEKLIGNYYFKKEEEKNTFTNIYSIGDSINIKGKLKVPKNNSIPNTFNYKKYLNNKKIYYILDIEEYKIVKKNKNIFWQLKNYIYKRIENIENNEYIYALVLGQSIYINSEAYRINGVSHLFSLSGLHVSLIASMILWIIKIIKKFINRKNICEVGIKTYIFIFAFLLLFAYITGFKPSFLRAIIFFMLMGINKVYYYNIKADNLLIIVHVIMIIINPFCIYDISFQLSWVITYFLFFTSELFKPRNCITKLLCSSFVALISSLPIIINNFYDINILSIINNLFFVPFISYIIYPLSLLSVIFPFLSKILLFLTNILDGISLFLSNIKLFSISFPRLTNVEIIIYYTLFILIIKKKKKISYIIMLIILLIIPFIKVSFDKRTSIYFIDVGQGDCALIRTENNKAILIDTGGFLKYNTEDWEKRSKEFSLMKSSIIPFFKSIGVKKIDYLFLTHGDEDHAGYAKELSNNYKVNNIIINLGEVGTLESELDYQLVKEKYIIDNIEIYSLNNINYNDENQNSLILLIVVEDKKILMMGDASVLQEKNIIKEYNLKDIFILKVGHHGSVTSTSNKFINTINPEYSIISVGKDNRFNHPSEKVLKTLENSIIFRTDQTGSIKITFDNKEHFIKTYNP